LFLSDLYPNFKVCKELIKKMVDRIALRYMHVHAFYGITSSEKVYAIRGNQLGKTCSLEGMEKAVFLDP